MDNDGWQYAIDFPRHFHGVKTNLDFVRRRRWCRKCKTSIPSYWIEIFQTLKITSIALDIETDRSLLPANSILIWATETDGSVVCAVINKDSPAICKWQYVVTENTIRNVTIGSNLKVYVVSTSGNVLCRYGVNSTSSFRGTNWGALLSSDPTSQNVRMKQISAGNCTLWAVSEDDSLYFRKEITPSYPEVRVNKIEYFQF